MASIQSVRRRSTPPLTVKRSSEVCKFWPVIDRACHTRSCAVLSDDCRRCLNANDHFIRSLSILWSSTSQLYWRTRAVLLIILLNTMISAFSLASSHTSRRTKTTLRHSPLHTYSTAVNITSSGRSLYLRHHCVRLDQLAHYWTGIRTKNQGIGFGVTSSVRFSIPKAPSLDALGVESETLKASREWQK